MLKIIEVKETLCDSKLVDNIYETQKIIANIINETEFILDINKDDYNYINIIMEKTRSNLEKVYKLLR